MATTNKITCKITGSINVHIKATSPDVDLNQPLYAVNWFSTKVEWLYHLYNFLAVRSVEKIGGRAFFKGKITETILDEANAKRDLLLIVRYPGGNNFKALLESGFFKIVSLLRMLAVKDFTFGFTKERVVSSSSNLNAGLAYAIHHFKINDIDITDKIERLKPDNIAIKYSGSMIAQLYSQRNSSAAEEVPNLLDGILIFEANSKEELTQMFSSVAYQSVIKELSSSYIGILRRII